MSEEYTYSRTELKMALTQATLMLCEGDIMAAAQLYDRLSNYAVVPLLPTSAPKIYTSFAL